MNQIKFEFPFGEEDKETMPEFESYLTRNDFSFEVKKIGGSVYFTVVINEPLNAFWIGCNLVAIQNGLFKKHTGKPPVIQQQF